MKKKNCTFSVTVFAATGKSSSFPTENCHLLSPTAKMNFHLTRLKTSISGRNLRVDILAVLFGVGAWLGVNAIFLQLPLLVETAPEGWSLPSYFVVCVQTANIGPLLYTLVQKYSPKKIADSIIIYMIYVIGCLTSILAIFLYQVTTVVAGEERSVALLAVTFLFAFVGCTSSVLFMPYMGRFRDIYLITYLIGEGMSGFISGIVALFQGVGGAPTCIPTNSTNDDGTPEYIKYSSPPLFRVKDFFVYVFIMMALSAIAFCLLDKLKMCRREYAAVTIHYGNDYEYDKSERNGDASIKRNSVSMKNGDCEIIQEINSESVYLSSFNYTFLLLLMGVLCMLANGILPSIQSFSCLPYGNTAYHFTVTLSSLANPMACFLAVFLNHTSIRNICLLAACIGIVCCYGFATAVLSPFPPFIGTIGGKILVVLCWTLINGLISYVKLSITAILRNEGGRSLVWVGSVAQIGSALGAICSFLLINQTNIFVSYEPC